MTKENARDFLPLVQALAEGKTIQHYGECRHTWEDCDNPHFDDDVNTYRIKPKEIWYVNYESGKYLIQNSPTVKQFEGSKEDCEKWIEEHTKKTWFEEYLYSNYGENAQYYIRIGAEIICKKILDEVRTNEGIEQMTKFYIGEIVQNLGVEI